MLSSIDLSWGHVFAVDTRVLPPRDSQDTAVLLGRGCSCCGCFSMFFVVVCCALAFGQKTKKEKCYDIN